MKPSVKAGDKVLIPQVCCALGSEGCGVRVSEANGLCAVRWIPSQGRGGGIRSLPRLRAPRKDQRVDHSIHYLG